MNNEIHEKAKLVLTSAKEIIYGQDNMLESILAALVCEGHVLIEGMPGLGKTLSVSVMSRLCDLTFKRIQFTPDLLPSDLIGTMIYSQKSEEFTTKFGPIFTQILLADEINRSPAKVQAALLEAMGETQVTIGETTHKLTSPFVVLATQNPIDQEGTYPLPEAQMDRFMMKVKIDYPDFAAEKSILSLTSDKRSNIEQVISTDNILELQDEVKSVYVDEKIEDMIVRIIHGTRPGTKFFLNEFEGVITAGASPRASIWLHRLGKFQAYMDGKDFVAPEHLLKIAANVLAHRVILTYEAMVDKISADDVVTKIAKELV